MVGSMNKQHAGAHGFLIVCILLSICFCTGCTQEQTPIEEDEPLIPTKNITLINVPAQTFLIKEQNTSFKNVTLALAQINESQTLYIGAGTYYESIFVDKSIILKGANASQPPRFILPQNESVLITINESYCTIDNLVLNCTREATVSNSTTAIFVSSSQNRIINSSINGFVYGIRIRSFSNGNRIQNTVFLNNSDGLEIVNSLSNKIQNNRFENHSRFAIYLGYNTRYSTVSNNLFHYNVEAVRLKSCVENTVSNNILYHDTFGIRECCGAEGLNTITNNLRFSN